jgi:hypothetical protein
MFLLSVLDVKRKCVGNWNFAIQEYFIAVLLRQLLE